MQMLNNSTVICPDQHHSEICVMAVCVFVTAAETSVQVIHRTPMPNKGDELHHSGAALLTMSFNMRSADRTGYTSVPARHRKQHADAGPRFAPSPCCAAAMSEPQ